MILAKPLAAALLVLGVTAPLHAEPTAAPYTSTLGRTMPPPGSGGPKAQNEGPYQKTATQKKMDRIQRGICIGCGAR